MSASFVDDDPPDPYEDLYENPLNYDVWNEFRDVGPDIARKLIDLFDSREEITGHVRNEISEALKAGLSQRFANPRQAHLCVSNTGQEKPGHPKRRANLRRTSIDRAKLINKYKSEFDKYTVPGVLNHLFEIDIEPPASERTLDKDILFYRYMLDWIHIADSLPFFIKLSKQFDLAEWQASEKAEQDFIDWGPDMPIGWKPDMRK